jgi:hypothetical protein
MPGGVLEAAEIAHAVPPELVDWEVEVGDSSRRQPDGFDCQLQCHPRVKDGRAVVLHAEQLASNRKSDREELNRGGIPALEALEELRRLRFHDLSRRGT